MWPQKLTWFSYFFSSVGTRSTCTIFICQLFGSETSWTFGKRIDELKIFWGILQFCCSLGKVQRSIYICYLTLHLGVLGHPLFFCKERWRESIVNKSRVGLRSRILGLVFKEQLPKGLSWASHLHPKNGLRIFMRGKPEDLLPMKFHIKIWIRRKRTFVINHRREAPRLCYMVIFLTYSIQMDGRLFQEREGKWDVYTNA